MRKSFLKIFLFTALLTIVSTSTKAETTVISGEPVKQPEANIQSPQLTTETQAQEKLPDEIKLTPPPENRVKITLEDSLKTALENNFDIKIVNTRQEQSKWNYYNNVSNFLPDITYRFSKARFGGEFLVGGLIPQSVSETVTDSIFTLRYPIFTGFNRYYNTKASKLNFKASQKNLDFTKDEVLLQTITQYYRVLEDKLNIEILKQNLEQAQEQLKINKQRFDAGVGTKFDVLRSEAEVASASQSLISAFNRLKLSQAQFANILGINVFTAILPAEEEAEKRKLIKDNLELQTLSEIAGKNRSDLEAAKLNAQASIAVKNSAYSTYIPQLNVFGELAQNGNIETGLLSNRSIGFEALWNGGIGLGFRGITTIKELGAKAKEAELSQINLSRGIQQDIISSYYDVITNEELIKASIKQVDAADESLRLSIVRLEAGIGIYIDVINARLTWTTAKIRYINSIINYNISQAKLLFDIGVISVDNVLNGVELNNKTNKPKK